MKRQGHPDDAQEGGAPPGRVRRAIAVTARAVGLGVVFALAAAGGALLHLGLPAPRRFATARVNRILAQTFKGRVVVDRLGALHLTRLDGLDAEVFDPEGQRVLYLQGVRAQLGTASLLGSLLSGDRLLVRIPELTINGVEATLEEDAAGNIGLVRAFESRNPSTGGRGAEIAVPEIHLRHAWVHGHLARAPLIDADLEDLEGSLLSTPKTTEGEVRHLFVRGRGLPGMNPEGTVTARAALPEDAADPRRVTARYDGRVGDIPVLVQGSLTGKEVSGALDVPETAPAAFAALAPGWIHLGAPVSAHAEVHGELPVLRPALRAHVGDAELTAAGVVTLPDDTSTELRATANVNVKGLDLGLLQEGAPRSRIDAALEASFLSRPGGRLSGTFHLENEVGEVSGQVVPAVSARGEYTERSVRGTAQVAERGAPTTVAFAVEPREGGTSPDQLTLKVDAAVPDLNDIHRVGPIGRGRAHIVAEGGMDLSTRRVSLNASVEVAGIDVEGVRVARGVVTGSAEGPLESPRVVAKVLGSGMRAGGYLFPSVRVSAEGSLREIAIRARLVGDDHAPTVTARAHVAGAGGLAVRGTVIDLQRGDVKSTARIAEVRVASGAVDLRGVTVEGLGAPVEASARVSPAGLRVKAKAADIDLARVATLLAREEDARGHLALDVDATASRGGVDGHVNGEVRALSVRDIEGGSASVVTSIHGTHVHGEVVAALGEVGQLRISAPDIVVGGAATEPSAWKSATGALTFLGSVNIAKLLARVPEAARPVDSAAGTITVRGSASRASSSVSPALALEGVTEGLAITAKREQRTDADGTVKLGPMPWRTEGLDGSFGVKLDGGSGRTEVSARLHDELGTLASVEVHGRLPLFELERTPDRALALVRDAPLEASLAVPRRSLDALPPALGALPVKGDVELLATFEGTMRAPRLTLSAKGTRLIPRAAAACVMATDVETRVAYDGASADVRLTASRAGREVMGADAAVKVDAAQAMAGGALAWEASGHVALTSFPLDTVGALVEQPISGAVSGKVALEDLHRAASLEADLDLKNLALDRAKFPYGKVHVGIKDGVISARARLEQSDGYAETGVTGAIAWGAEIAPRVDLGKPVEVAIKAKDFRADAALPFVRGVFSELDGRIDTDTTVHVDPGGKDGRMNGAIAIRDGIFEVPQLGERFHGLRGNIIMEPWGTLRFEDFYAEGVTGKLTASAEAVVKGLALQSATGRIHIASGQSIPIALEGVPMGRAYGDVTTTAKMSADGKRLYIGVDIPVLHVDLPQSTGHAVQPLEPDTTVRVGLHDGRDFVAIPLSPPEKPRPPSDLHIHASVELGGDVEVKRDTTVDLVVSGRIDVDVSDKWRLTGQINLDHGKLELQGKLFTIDRGTVSFAGPDPENPLIMATAFWDAPDATRVYADFSGYASSGKLNLHSEPALTQDEILALILFGSTDGGLAAQAPPGQEESTGIKAAGMAGGVVTQGLNKAISGLTTADITTRVDTSKADSPRPELAVQISRKVSARLGYELGVPAPGENPDRTELTLEWRFSGDWSLVAVVGDQGSTALDLVWRRRY